MSGTTVCHALHDHFDAVRRRELDRLKKKLRALTDAERMAVDAITADVIRALAAQPARVIGDEPAPTSADLLVRLFKLPVENAELET